MGMDDGAPTLCAFNYKHIQLYTPVGSALLFKLDRNVRLKVSKKVLK